jgi:hypothetical protein
MATHPETEWQFDPGAILLLVAGDTYVLDQYTEDSWNGADGNLVTVQSGTPGTPAIIDISAIGDIGPLSCVRFIDITFVGGTVTCDSTCVDGGGNDGIEFQSESDMVQQNSMSMAMGLAF